MATTCGAALIALLEQYGVDTVFGIPGVHNLEMYRGLADSSIHHVQARNEAGAGFMADGFARASGRPGVALVISGPGVTNAATPLGQAYADSIPLLLISAVTQTNSLGKGWGTLHEITDQEAVTRPLTALSATAMSPADLPMLIHQAFTVFTSQRPRPVHISVPIDVAEAQVEAEWEAAPTPTRPVPDAKVVDEAARLLLDAERPSMYVGGGAVGAERALTAIAERIDATVFTSNAGKGIVADSHPLNLGTSIWRRPAQEHLGHADVVLAIGTEIGPTDSFVDKLALAGDVIRVDIDPSKIDDVYPATIGIIADATSSAEMLADALGPGPPSDHRGAQRATSTLDTITASYTDDERRHGVALAAIRRALPPDTIVMTDMTQLVYSGSSMFPVEGSRRWLYPAGFCVLGCGVPGAIGAKLAMPNRPVATIVGDGGFMFTPQELIVATELAMPLPVILWNNRGLQQITDNMHERDIKPIGSDGINPDFMMLASSMGARGRRPDSIESLETAITDALVATAPTVIEIDAAATWLAPT